MTDLDNLKILLNKVGSQIEEVRRTSQRKKISTRQDLVSFVPVNAGLYWIETNMPDEEMLEAIKKTTGKDDKRMRKNRPLKIDFTKADNGIKIIYSGTRSNIQSRLLEHLFNEGNDQTGKLGCKIEDKPFSEYEWYVSYHEIEDEPVRIAIEHWWRLNIGWPPFCLR